MKKSFLFASLTVPTFFIFSSLASAQATAQDAASGFNTLAGLITLFTNTIVRATGTLLLSAAVVAFFFGVVQYIWGMRQGDAGKAKIGNEFMIWGLVGLFVMFSVYGIIKFGQGILFNGKDVTSIVIPDINLKGSGSGSPSGSPLGGSGSGSNATNPLGGSGVGGPAGGGVSGQGGSQNTCPDGITPLNDPYDFKFCPKPMMCPDGKTPYYNASDRKFCPAQ